MRDHPERGRVGRELHARPFVTLAAPVQLLHLALLHDPEQDARASREHLMALCQRHGVQPPATDGNQFTSVLGDTHVKWEHHAEFTSWTLWRERDGTPFDGRAESVLEADWLDDVPGLLLVAVRVHVLGRDDPPPARELLDECFDPRGICGSSLGDGATLVWTDFHPDAEGTVRMLLQDRGSDARALGRRVQRLLEIETYRSMALLGLSMAQDAGPEIAAAEERLADITSRLEILTDLDAEQALLADMMKLSAKLEEIVTRTAYRFSASRAYFEIVLQRLARLGEAAHGDLPTIGGFMDRRLTPAMRTCESTVARQEALAARILRAANLLRTRVELAMESQNRDLLRSMERRVRLQLRLQQTVEGLSVAAITYYVVGLVSYLAKSAESAGAAIDTAYVTGIAVPVVAGTVWFGLQRFRRRLESAEAQD